ncbi:Lipase (class 3) [Geosmithia morbida]|uniref:sn-1-specific diacylglycerol lipase n=1 Tax=Geosmithia morbida TaxID=1094350 RepID=A0A9P4YRY2_9HYPO|nr:Lipase (class 3) [Geosmithia morbida]KAF4119909.1 Lipase (class 3) [Geosmithia morbida]
MALKSASPVAVLPQPGPTLLPNSVARVVSLATRSTSLAIRVGSFFGSYGLDAARFTTLSSLELARTMVEGILLRAGRDAALRPRSDMAAADADTLLERALEALHGAASQAVFWTSASFQLTGTTFFAASELSQLLLSSLDQLFGSTDSSRAIASIITLIRREFKNPATGDPAEQVGVVDLIIALAALAYLQRMCRKSLDDELRSSSHEQVIWDVVVVDDGTRVDVLTDGDDCVKTHVDETHSGSPTSPVSLNQRPSSSGGPRDDDQVFNHLQTHIASSLSPGTSVSISNSVQTTQTITVDVHGLQSMTLPTPPGAEIVEAKTHVPSHAQDPADPDAESSYRVVYRIQRDKLRTASFHRHEDEPGYVTELDSSADSQPCTPPQRQASSSRLMDPLPLVPATPEPPSQTGSPQSDKGHSQQRMNIPRRTPPQVNLSPPSSIPSSTTDSAANQKKQRSPLHKSSSRGNLGKAKPESTKQPTKKKTDLSPSDTKSLDKKSGLKQVLKGSGQSFSQMWNKDGVILGSSSTATRRPRPQWKTVGKVVEPSPVSTYPSKPATCSRIAKGSGQRSGSQASIHLDPESIPRSSSRASYVSVHERRRDSVVSQADAYTLHAGGLRPASPSIMRADMASHETLSRQPDGGAVTPSPYSKPYHRRNISAVPSLYSLATNDSQASLVLSAYYKKSAYHATGAMETLRRAGAVEGTFPSAHLLQNITRYMRFSSASYGSRFLKLMGISNSMPKIQIDDETHHDVRHFAHHTESPSGNVLLASFVDSGGGSNASGATDSGMPLVYYISLDHEAKAVVLACRGTLGFEDILTDLTCDYDRLMWRGRSYRVHKGIHASARRILYGGDGRVLITLQEALREFPDYGLVLCGHSLGGAVTSLLGVMLAEPNPHGTGFVTAYDLPSGGGNNPRLADIRLPAGRPIHVFAYGPPGAMSVTLCKITKGLITTVVHGSDLVPHLSLGVLHDFQGVAVAFKKDEHRAKAEIRKHIWHAIQSNMGGGSNSLPPSAPTEQSGTIEELDGQGWMLATLSSMRSNMNHEKLMPPGEVFCIESHRVLRRDAFLLVSDDPAGQRQHIGRPAQRIVLRYVKDVEARFREVRFGTGMLIDHSPANYENALNKLRLGVSE